MISIPYELFTIYTNKAVPGTYAIKGRTRPGTIPVALTGAYTSVGLAQEDIDRYMKRTQEKTSVSKTRAKRGTK